MEDTGKNKWSSIKNAAINIFKNHLGYHLRNIYIKEPWDAYEYEKDYAFTVCLLGRDIVWVYIDSMLPPSLNYFDKKLDVLHTVAKKESVEFILYYEEVENGYVVGLYDVLKNMQVTVIELVDDLKKDLHISNFLPKIEEIHSNYFNYLHEEHKGDQSFTFYLRSSNVRRRLDKGYFFLGNDEYCAISFWAGRDWKNKTSNIYIEITMEGEVRLILSAKDSEKKALFLEQIADLVDAKQLKQKGEERPVWIKSYSRYWQKDYLEILKEFIRKDKEIIDAQIFKAQRREDANLEDIDFISIEDFKPNLERALTIRNRIAHSINTIETTKEEDKEAIRLQFIRLQQIAMFENFSIDLSSRITCIIGDNGTGKTSLLKAIALGLIGVDESTEINIEHPKFKELQALLRMTGLDEHGNIRYGGKGKIDLTYQMREKYTNTILLEQEEHALDVVLKDDIESDGFVGLIDSNYFPNLVIAFTQGGHVRDYKFGSYEMHRGNIGDISALLFNTKQEYFEDLEEWIFNLDGDSSDNNRAGEILNFVFEVVSGVVGLSVTLEGVEHQRKEIWVRIDQDEPVLFKLVSQGFTKVFAWIGHFIKRLSETNPDLENFKEAKAILLIDEIDTYLHPKWQRNILAFLAKTFTNTQFIVTTHSPLVANYINSKEVNGNVALYRLERKKNSVEAVRFDKIYGRDLSAIFYDWMGINDRPKEVTHKIDKILALIDEETKESIEKAKELLQDLELEEHDVIMSEIQASLSYAEENFEE